MKSKLALFVAASIGVLPAAAQQPVQPAPPVQAAQGPEDQATNPDARRDLPKPTAPTAAAPAATGKSPKWDVNNPPTVGQIRQAARTAGPSPSPCWATSM